VILWLNPEAEMEVPVIKKQGEGQPMKLRALLAIPIFAATLPVFAATSCPGAQILVGNNCTLLTALGWATAGLGTQSVVTLYVPPNASGPVTFQATAFNSSLGSAYTGYFGIVVGIPGQPGTMLLTLADAKPNVVNPGQTIQFLITNICFDPTCTAAAPAGAVPNMFSAQVLISSPNSADINLNDVQLTVQFVNGSQVTFQEQETSSRTNSPFSIIPGINLGATPAGRYVYNGAAVTLPFDVLSVSNFNNPSPISGSATLQDNNGNTIAMAPIAPIPPGGAAGFLVIGRTPGDPLALFDSSIVLPAGPDGIFHGTLVVGMNGLIPAGLNVVLAQEFNGNSMLNLFVFHSPVP
jgi:hypothetical protein